MEEYLSEIYQDDLIANNNEEVFAKSLGNVFVLESVLKKSFRAVNRLKDHITTIEKDISRTQQNKMNLLLFIFTLISILGVSGGLITLYDFTNNISPISRLIIVFLSLIISILISIIFLIRHKKFDHKE